MPATSGDPRIGLSSGLENAGTASLGVTHLANRPKPTGVNGTNSDMAIQGNYAFNGNFSGINIYDISNPVNPALKTSIVCPASQNDVTVYKNLLFVGVETSGRANCGPNNAGNPSPNFRGIRIFDITNIEAPVNVAGVETCRGAHTLTLVRPKNDAAHVYIYVMGTAGPRQGTELAGCDGNNSNTPTGANPSKWRIEVIKVPLAAPQNSAVVDESRLFAGARRRASTACRTPSRRRSIRARRPRRPAARARRTRAARAGPRRRSPTRATTSRSTRRSTSRPAPARATAC